jgi:phosphoglycolate phosphatase
MLIIFDYDGTLTNTFEFNYRVIKKYLKTQNIKFNKKDFIWIGSKNPFERFKQFGLTTKQINDLIFDLEKESIAKDSSTLRYAGIKNLIKKISKEHKVMVISSNTGKVIKHFLKNNKMTKYITEIQGAEKEKSKVIKLKKIIKKYKQDAIYIADSAGDVIEARQAKVKSVAVSWGFTPLKILKLVKPNYLVNKPEQILKIIDKLEKQY